MLRKTKKLTERKQTDRQTDRKEDRQTDNFSRQDSKCASHVNVRYQKIFHKKFNLKIFLIWY